jgi:hypothetical protein
MKDDPLDQLETRVRRAASSLAARPGRKRQMQDELLGHLDEIFDQALDRTGGDELAAANEAERRFGNLEALRQELQSSVPLLERALFTVLCRKEIPVSRTAWWVVLVLGLIAWSFTFPEQAPVMIGALGMLAAIGVVRCVQQHPNAVARWLRFHWLWLVGAFAILFGPSIILPAMAHYGHEGVPTIRVAMPIAMGTLILLAGIATIAYRFTARRAAAT